MHNNMSDTKKKNTKKNNTKNKRSKRNRKTQLLQCLAGMVVGGAVGYFGMKYVEKMHGGSLRPTEILMGLIWLVICLYAAAFLHVIVHEAGHLVCGLLSGYKFSSFRVGRIIAAKKKDGIRWGRYSLMGTGGQCLLAPPELVDGKMPYILYNLGGSLFNLLLALAALLLCLGVEGHGYLQILFMALFIVGIFLSLMNAVPLPVGGVNNDGYNALYLGKDKEAVRCFWLQLKINEQLTLGKRLRDMPREWFAPVPEEKWSNAMCASTEVLAVSRAIDEKDFGTVLKMGEKLLEKAPGLIGIQRYALKGEMIFCRLMLDGPGEELRREYREKGFQEFLKRSVYMLSVLRLQYACKRILDPDEEAAQKCLELFDKVSRRYPFDGDKESERELISNIDNIDSSLLTGLDE